MEPETNGNGNKLFANEVAGKEKRKLQALRDRKGTAWYGLGMFGMVGWSVAVPCLLGAALGRWLDGKNPQPFSWTLTFLVAGLFAGCWAGWYWVDKENKKMHENNDE